MLDERVLQETPRAKQSRADRPDRDVERGRHFLVRHSFHVNQLYCDTIRFRESADRVANRRSELQLLEQMIDSRLARCSMRSHRCELLDIRIVAHGLHDRFTSDTCAMNVSTDRDQPAPAVGSWRVRTPEPISTQKSFLREIIAVGGASSEYASESRHVGKPSQRLVSELSFARGGTVLPREITHLRNTGSAADASQAALELFRALLVLRSTRAPNNYTTTRDSARS
jgi:hypothetical protein